MDFFAPVSRLSVALFALALLICPHSSRAQWSDDPAVNNPISMAASSQESPIITGDGAGGGIVVWQDRRSGNYDIYVQRIDASGVVQWTSDGVAISTAANDQIKPMIISDSAGGAIITWQDHRSGIVDIIYAQRINALGAVQWTADGVAISASSTVAYNQTSPTITSDGAGGAIITWEDTRSGNDIYAQRINASGVVQWTDGGVAISTAANGQFFPQITADGVGGAIITWRDQRSGDNYDIYAQRINASGAVQWTADGVAISTVGGNDYQLEPTIISDDSGGAIITWEDSRNVLTSYDIYAQRIDSSGTVQWTVNGVAISTVAYNQTSPTMTNDGAGGAFIAWPDGRSGNNSEIYVQRINASGAVQWTADGVAVSPLSAATVPEATADGTGGAIITWQDHRNGDADVYAQRINASGTVQWTANGVAISKPVTTNQVSPSIIRDNTGGAIVTWQDHRNEPGTDVYASRVFDSGVLPVEFVSMSCVSSMSSVTIVWSTSTETSNYGFEIERRQVQRNEATITGSENWIQIGFIRGSGTSSSPRDYSFLDENLSPGRYAYRIKQIDLSGHFTYTQAAEVELSVPAGFALQQNYPNPFNPETEISFGLPEPSSVTVIVVDVLGREIATLTNGQFPAGYQRLRWNGRDSAGRQLSSGVYFYRINAVGQTGREFTKVLRMTLAK